jgi:hypothetical protein
MKLVRVKTITLVQVEETACKKINVENTLQDIDIDGEKRP